MAVKIYPNKDIVNLDAFTRVERGHWQYYSTFSARTYTLHLIKKAGGKFYWDCDCPQARRVAHPKGEQCKHEKALARMLKNRYEQKCMAEMQAEQIVEEIQQEARAEESAEIAALRAEIEAMKTSQNAENWELRAEVANLRSQLFQSQGQQQSAQPADLAPILAEIQALKAENVEIKKQLAGKATKRKKHQSETEAADVKRTINIALDETIEAAKSAISAAEHAREEIKALEAIPHQLKEELDSWTAAGKEELQPSHKEPEANSDEVRGVVRAAQESARKRREATLEERREMAPLNSNGGFQFYR